MFYWNNVYPVTGEIIDSRCRESWIYGAVIISLINFVDAIRNHAHAIYRR